MDFKEEMVSSDIMSKNKEILIEINGKKVPLSKLPCNKCEWNRNGKVKVY